jgi:glutaredoxin
MSREVTLYTRRQCGLCDETAAALRALSGELRFTIVEVDIDTDAALRERYNDVVPVVAVGERVIAQAPVDEGALRSLLGEALG